MNNRAKKDIEYLKSIAKNLNIRNNIITLDLIGPKDSYYEGDVYSLRIEIPEEFPFKSPSVGFMSKIFHPNIDYRSGSICLNVLNQTWTPIYNLNHIYSTFIPQLLLYPNPDDPLNKEAADLYLTDIELFKKRVKESII